jgi:hypothetical protein
MLNILHNIPVWELSLQSIGLLNIYHHFQLRLTFSFSHNTLLQGFSEKHANFPSKTNLDLKSKKGILGTA